MKEQKITSISDAEQYLFSRIPQVKQLHKAGGHFLLRAKRLMKLLGDPQEKMQVVHVAGTSGKGSTVYLTSEILRACGQKTGAFFSPHLWRITERFTIDGKELPEKEFVAIMQDVHAAAQKMKGEPVGAPTYFEMLAAVAYKAFARAGVDIAVIETGLGGMFDATNACDVPEKIAVITDIGLDHTKLLGDTVKKIAEQKAGIIHRDNDVLSFVTDEAARTKIAEKTKDRRATLMHELSMNDIQNVKTAAQGTTFTLDGEQWHVGLHGTHQARNAALAIVTAKHLSAREGFAFDEKKVRGVLKKAELLGRMTVRKINGKTVVFDCAHNPQKMDAFLQTLAEIYPSKKFHTIFACKSTKDATAMLAALAEHSMHITLTEFGQTEQDMMAASQTVQELSQTLQDLHYETFSIADKPKSVLEKALDGDQQLIVVTGSLHLVAQTLR